MLTSKRLLLILGVLFVCAAGTAAYILAVNTAQDTFSRLDPTPTAAVNFAPSGRSEIRTLHGIIHSLRRQKLVITLQNGGATATVAVDNTTTYTSSNRSIPFTALKVGQLVEVKGRVISAQSPLMVTALSITLLP
jgi:hypothetical protein